MKYRWMYLLLAAEAVLLIVLCLTGWTGSAMDAAAAMAFPYAALGALLRALSLSGAAGNTAAWALYLLLGLLPVAWLLIRCARRRAHAEDALLAVFSAVLFYALYLFINPAQLAARTAPDPGMYAEMQISMGGAALGCTLHALLLAYAVLRVMRFSGEKERGAYAAMRWLLYAVLAVLVFGVFGSGLSGLLRDVEALRAGNSALPASDLAVSMVFLAAQALVQALPLLLGIPIALQALRLIDAASAEPYSEATAAAAHRMGAYCRAAVTGVLLSQVALNLLQLMLADAVRSSSYTVSLPLAAILLMLSAALLARLIERGRRIKEDNDSII